MAELHPQTIRFLTQKQLAELLNVSERTLERWRLQGRGPRFVALGARRRGYRLSDVVDWTSSRTFCSAAEAKAEEAKFEDCQENENSRSTRPRKH